MQKLFVSLWSFLLSSPLGSMVAMDSKQAFLKIRPLISDKEKGHTNATLFRLVTCTVQTASQSEVPGQSGFYGILVHVILGAEAEAGKRPATGISVFDIIPESMHIGHGEIHALIYQV